MEIAWSLSACVALLIAVAMLAWTVRRQAAALERLVLRKPYWIVERNEQGGIENIVKLDATGHIKEGDSPHGEPQFAGDEPEVPGMYPEDEPIELGERRG